MTPFLLTQGLRSRKAVIKYGIIRTRPPVQQDSFINAVRALICNTEQLERPNNSRCLALERDEEALEAISDNKACHS